MEVLSLDLLSDGDAFVDDTDAHAAIDSPSIDTAVDETSPASYDTLTRGQQQLVAAELFEGFVYYVPPLANATHACRLSLQERVCVQEMQILTVSRVFGAGSGDWSRAVTSWTWPAAVRC